MRKKTPIERVHTRNTIVFKIIILILLLSIFIFFALNSPLFNIKEIKVNNNKYLKKEDILNQSKIRKNSNIFKLNSKVLKYNLEKNPSIKSVKIKRRIPGTVEIELTERERTFLFQYISMYLLIDDEGVIIDHLEKKDKELPVVKGFTVNSTKILENIFIEEENEKLKTFISESKNLNILSKMDEIDKDFANDVNIKLKSGIFVAFGTLNNVKYKLGLLKEILVDVEKKEIKNGKIIMNKGNHPILIIDD